MASFFFDPVAPRPEDSAALEVEEARHGRKRSECEIEADFAEKQFSREPARQRQRPEISACCHDALRLELCIFPLCTVHFPLFYQQLRCVCSDVEASVLSSPRLLTNCVLVIAVGYRIVSDIDHRWLLSV
jgi:hypothetical protein